MATKRKLLSRDEFESLRTKPKNVVLSVLEQFVVRPAGKPKSGKKPLTGAERAKLFRQRNKKNSKTG
jgi:hypothetical protein